MARSADETRMKILASAYRLIRRHGFARVKMSDIATGASLTKRTLYHHFDSKDALLAAMLDAQHDLAVATFVKMIDRPKQGPEQVVEGIFADLVSWSATKHWEGSGFTRLAIELADLPGHPARRMARQHKATLEHLLTERLESDGISDAAVVAREILVLIEGAMVMILIHGDRSYASIAAVAAQGLFRIRRLAAVMADSPAPT
ncbi:MAG: TetR/AcrR family transcriptional regulator [Mesorhizobium sp.]|nr:MAG: TetR/AcrR family transcriptional regulator [Mesorhizobium sp.]